MSPWCSIAFAESAPVAVWIVAGTAWAGGLLALAYFFAFVPWREKRRSRAELPRLAAQYGLAWHESRTIGSLGTFGGQFRGHHVWLEPDRGTVKVWLRNDYDLELTPWEPALKPEKGWTEFDSPSPAFNRKFLTRYAARELAPHLSVPGPAVEKMSAYLQNRSGWLQVRGRRVEHHPLRERHPEYIPLKWFRERFASFVDFAASFDELLLPATGKDAERYRTCASCGAVHRVRAEGRHGSCEECSASPGD